MFIIIAGAGLVGSNLAKNLMLEKHDVVIIDKNQDKCDTVFADTGVIAITGSITSVDILKEAGIEKADVVVAATENDASNIVFAILSKTYNVPYIIGRINHPDYEKSYKAAGVNTLLNENEILVNQMLLKIHYPELTRVASIGGRQGNIYKLTVPKNGIIVGKTIKEIVQRADFPKECLFMSKISYKTKEFAIIHGDNILESNDEVFFIARLKVIGAITKLLTNTKKE